MSVSNTSTDDRFKYFKVCLKRKCSEERPKHPFIPLENKKVIVGRSVDATYNILNDMISRQHAVLSEDESGQWNIMDNKSLNGVYVNGERLNHLEPKPLIEGDLVQFGIPTVSGEFVYEYCTNQKVERRILEKERSSKRMRIEKPATIAGPSTSREVNWISKPNSGASSRSQSPQHVLEHSYCTVQNVIVKLESDINSSNHNNQIAAVSSSLLPIAQEELQKNSTPLEDTPSTGNQIISHSQDEPSSSISGTAPNQDSLPHLQMMEAHLALQKRLAEMEELIAKKDAELRLMQERESTKEGSQEKDEPVIEEAVEVGHPQAEVYHALEPCEKEEEVACEVAAGGTEEAGGTTSGPAVSSEELVPLQAITDIVESELMCSICSELFVQAVTLNCSHSFCQLCIKQWKLSRPVTQPTECPMCRTRISSESRSVVLDSLISRMVEQLGKEARDSREELLKERQTLEQIAAAEVTVAGPSHAAGIFAPNIPPTSGTAVPNIIPAIVISDSEDEYNDSGSGDDSTSSMEGDSDAFYGGYGRCYNCGRRGHWAPGCPF